MLDTVLLPTDMASEYHVNPVSFSVTSGISSIICRMCPPEKASNITITVFV